VRTKKQRATAERWSPDSWVPRRLSNDITTRALARFRRGRERLGHKRPLYGVLVIPSSPICPLQSACAQGGAPSKSPNKSSRLCAAPERRHLRLYWRLRSLRQLMDKRLNCRRKRKEAKRQECRCQSDASIFHRLNFPFIVLTLSEPSPCPHGRGYNTPKPGKEKQKRYDYRCCVSIFHKPCVVLRLVQALCDLTLECADMSAPFEASTCRHPSKSRVHFRPLTLPSDFFDWRGKKRCGASNC
jgi:hypothetical protein